MKLKNIKIIYYLIIKLRKLQEMFLLLDIRMKILEILLKIMMMMENIMLELEYWDIYKK
jgi:hypothetical protein